MAWLPDHNCQTARYASFAGLKNGKLLAAAETAGFEVIVTVDQNILHQQDLRNRCIAVVILRAPTNRLEYLKQTIPAALGALAVIKPGEVITVSRTPEQLLNGFERVFKVGQQGW